jgi:microcystin-dependent protein
MAQPYVGEIRMFAGSFAPAGWMFCDGQLLPISENETLFQLLGTTYGGDGQSTFALPDLRGRLPIHQGSGFILAQNGGVESVTLTTQQIPIHSHPMLASSDFGTATAPSNNMPAKPNTANTFLYINEDPTGAMANTSIGPAGGSQPHDNMQPYLCISFIISLFGLFPSQT